MEILYHHILTPCGEPADVIISAMQKFIRRGKTEEAAVLPMSSICPARSFATICGRGF